MRLTEVRRRRIWGNFAGISLLIAVRRPERSESPQGVAKLRSNFEFRIRRWRDATIFK